VIAKEENRRNGFPLLNKHIKFYEEIQETDTFQIKNKKQHASKNKKQYASK